ncbi:hypothetical protein BDV28DRAFT_144957 [Aspergillus coremiiformis]|uniref:Uncharacterized protein n=1 Tax=Aspergillus coremiiformis TaxID=138285 RepID=A0A5N6ZG86_9EURO|nr:hypothetical protein BDV28DRAFT_144957 [Aspergillus coremiiformis]
MASSANTTEGSDHNHQDCQFIFECLRNIDESKTVNLTDVGLALGYTNTASVGNRFRAVRKKYGFLNLDATSKSSSMTTNLTAPVSSSPPGQAKNKNTSAGRKKSVSKTEPSEVPPVADDSEAERIAALETSKAKKKLSPKKGARKGAKVTSTPIVATGLGASTGKRNSQAFTAVESKVEDEIDINLLDAVNDTIVQLENGEGSDMV